MEVRDRQGNLHNVGVGDEVHIRNMTRDTTVIIDMDGDKALVVTDFRPHSVPMYRTVKGYLSRDTQGRFRRQEYMATPEMIWVHRSNLTVEGI